MDTTTTSRLERDRGTDDAATTTGSVGTPPPVDPSRHRSGLSLWSMRHRWLVLALSVLALAAGIALMATSGIQTTPPEDQLVGDSAVAAEIEERAGLYGTPTETVVATAKDGSLTDAEVTTIGTELATAYRDVEGIADIGEPQAGADGRSVVLTLTLDAEDDPAEGSTAPSPSEAVGPSLEATAAFAAANPELTVGQIGDGSVTKEVDATLGADFKRAELISIPLTLAILLVAFGAVVAAGVPLVLGLGSVGVALGLTAAASNGILPVDPNAQSLILLIGLAVGVDYALFVIRRAREERAAGADVRDSIALAGATAGRAVVISGITVIVAMSGMLVAGGLFTSLALGAMLVVLAAVIASATTLPALLAVLGDRVDALRLRGRPGFPPARDGRPRRRHRRDDRRRCARRPPGRRPGRPRRRPGGGRHPAPRLGRGPRGSRLRRRDRNRAARRHRDGRLGRPAPRRRRGHPWNARAPGGGGARRGPRRRGPRRRTGGRDRPQCLDGRPAPVGRGLRARAHAPRHDDLVRLTVARRGDRGAQRPLRRRGVRPDDARVPRHLGRGRPRLLVDRRDRRVVADADVRHPLRAVDGLPRVRDEPRP